METNRFDGIRAKVAERRFDLKELLANASDHLFAAAAIVVGLMVGVGLAVGALSFIFTFPNVFLGLLGLGIYVMIIVGGTRFFDKNFDYGERWEDHNMSATFGFGIFYLLLLVPMSIFWIPVLNDMASFFHWGWHIGLFAPIG